MTRCSAALSWRVAAGVQALSDGVARARRDPRDAGRARELGGGREAVSASDLADELGGDQRSESWLSEQFRCEPLDDGGDFAFELDDGRRQFAQPAQTVAGDPDAHRLLARARRRSM